MKTLKHTFIAIGLACLTGACTSSKQEETQGLKTTHIAIDNSRTDVKLSEFAEAKLLPLPTSDDVLIGNISRIRTSEKSICISDGNAIYRFSRSGEFLGKIEKKGQGPDEYTAISDFVVADDENVWVLPMGKSLPMGESSLMLYSWDNRLVKELKIESAYRSQIHRMGDKLLLHNGNHMTDNNKHTLQVVDMNTGETLQRFLPIDEYKAKYLYLVERNNFHPGESDTICYYSTAHNDTTYRVTPHTCQAYQTFDFDGKNIPADFYRQDFFDAMEFDQKLENGGIYKYQHFITDNAQWLGYRRTGEGTYAVLIDKEGKQTNMKEFQIDELASYPYSIQAKGWTDNKYVTGHNEIIFILQPMDILEYIEEHTPEAMEDIKKKIQYTTDDQNPVLMIVNLK